MSDQVPYRETHRPQFHFSAQKNWINDPNGLVYYEGEVPTSFFSIIQRAWFGTI